MCERRTHSGIDKEFVCESCGLVADTAERVFIDDEGELIPICAACAKGADNA